MAKKKSSKKKAPKKAAKKSGKKVAKKVTKKTVKKAPKKAAPKKKAATKKATKKVSKKITKKAAPKKVAVKKAAKAVKSTKPAVVPSAPKTKVKAIMNTQSPDTHPLVGQSAPDFTLPKQDGEHLNLASLNQGKVILYFYPKDDTPGCTTEACGFRDSLNRLQSAGITVLGVSPDSPESHVKFIEKYSLNFDLLSDIDHKLAETLNVWKEKNFMGKNYMGIERSTFLINNGTIVKGWQPVKVEGHVDEVLQAAETL